jgi:serine/threonine-protein kinase RsbW
MHPDDVSDLKVALTEACTNSVRYAYGSDDGTVDISFELDDDSIAIEVTDDGPGFEPQLIKDPGELAEGGLGLAIIQALTDDAQIGRRADGTGSRVRFDKRLSPFSTDEEL